MFAQISIAMFVTSTIKHHASIVKNNISLQQTVHAVIVQRDALNAQVLILVIHVLMVGHLRMVFVRTLVMLLLVTPPLSLF